jgi:hypothetical protein
MKDHNYRRELMQWSYTRLNLYRRSIYHNG